MVKLARNTAIFVAALLLLYIIYVLLVISGLYAIWIENGSDDEIKIALSFRDMTGEAAALSEKAGTLRLLRLSHGSGELKIECRDDNARVENRLDVDYASSGMSGFYIVRLDGCRSMEHRIAIFPSFFGIHRIDF